MCSLQPIELKWVHVFKTNWPKLFCTNRTIRTCGLLLEHRVTRHYFIMVKEFWSLIQPALFSSSGTKPVWLEALSKQRPQNELVPPSHLLSWWDGKQRIQGSTEEFVHIVSTSVKKETKKREVCTHTVAQPFCLIVSHVNVEWLTHGWAPYESRWRAAACGPDGASALLNPTAQFITWGSRCIQSLTCGLQTTNTEEFSTEVSAQSQSLQSAAENVALNYMNEKHKVWWCSGVEDHQYEPLLKKTTKLSALLCLPLLESNNHPSAGQEKQVYSSDTLILFHVNIF